MIATCKCGVVVTAPDDKIIDQLRDFRSLMMLGSAMFQHLQDAHPDRVKEIVTLSGQFNAYMVMLDFNSTEKAFIAAVEKGRELFAELSAKPSEPMLSTIPNRNRGV